MRTALAVPASPAMPEAAAHAMAETAAAVGEACAVIEAATYAMGEPVAEFAVPAIMGPIRAVR